MSACLFASAYIYTRSKRIDLYFYFHSETKSAIRRGQKDEKVGINPLRGPMLLGASPYEDSPGDVCECVCVCVWWVGVTNRISLQGARGDLMSCVCVLVVGCVRRGEGLWAMNVQCGCVRPGVVDRMVDCIYSGSSNNIDASLLSFHIYQSAMH